MNPGVRLRPVQVMWHKAVDPEGELIAGIRERKRGQGLDLEFGRPRVWLSVGRAVDWEL